MAKYIYLLLLLSPVVLAQHPSDDPERQYTQAAREGIPDDLHKVFAASGLSEEYEMAVGRVNPFYLWGDFNGEGMLDYAVRLQWRGYDEVQTVAVLFGEGSHVLFDGDLQDYTSFSSWSVVPRSKKLQRALPNGPEPPVLKGDAIMMHKLETSSWVVFWNGEHFLIYASGGE